MTEKFIKKEHYLDYDVKPTHSIKLGFTTREWTESLSRTRF